MLLSLANAKKLLNGSTPDDSMSISGLRGEESL